MMRGHWGQFASRFSVLTVGTMMVTLGVAIITGGARDLPEWITSAVGIALVAWGLGMVVNAGASMYHDAQERRTQAWAARMERAAYHRGSYCA